MFVIVFVIEKEGERNKFPHSESFLSLSLSTSLQISVSFNLTHLIYTSIHICIICNCEYSNIKQHN